MTVKLLCQKSKWDKAYGIQPAQLNQANSKCNQNNLYSSNHIYMQSETSSPGKKEKLIAWKQSNSFKFCFIWFSPQILETSNDKDNGFLTTRRKSRKRSVLFSNKRYEGIDSISIIEEDSKTIIGYLKFSAFNNPSTEVEQNTDIQESIANYLYPLFHFITPCTLLPFSYLTDFGEECFCYNL